MTERCARCGNGGLFLGRSRICEGCRADLDEGRVLDPRDYVEVPEGAYPWPT